MSKAGAGVFWARGFRPFFLLAGLQAVVAIGLWLSLLRGWLPASGWSTPLQWHAHEMLFGFTGATIAGFLLTSVPVWTGRSPVAGARLAALAGLWLAGRVAVFSAASLPSPWIAAALDVSFLAALAVAIAPSIYASRSRRNYAFPLLVVVMALANYLTHLGAIGIEPAASQAGVRLAVGVVVILLAVIGGRLVPLFSRNALARAGIPAEVSELRWTAAASGPLLVAFVAADLLWPGSPLSGVLALAAAVTVALRATGWKLRHSFRDPLLWSMHIAYLWIPLGLGLLALTAFGSGLPRNIGIHALTAGAIGGMTLAIMTRVSLGHTGRPFRAPRGIAVAYVLVHTAALFRTLALHFVPAGGGGLLIASAVLWIGAFAIFLAIFAPMLVSPRIDGKPG